MSEREEDMEAIRRVEDAPERVVHEVEVVQTWKCPVHKIKVPLGKPCPVCGRRLLLG